ncbi:MAG: helix-turn-helix domain-containing protein [Syntrophobacteraceae bacterium]|nr:helix-turn-helix domain-containing protein [Syntrophobacteraceae bacterium]
MYWIEEKPGDVLTIDELAAYLKIPKSTLYKLVRSRTDHSAPRAVRRKPPAGSADPQGPGSVGVWRVSGRY